ncbi:hypothetical protein BDZ94DRAFT_1264274, partial [Collybia nuda]
MDISRISLQMYPKVPCHGFGLAFTEITGKPWNTCTLAKWNMSHYPTQVSH